ncbi:sulfite exporter TauE/SafE family protein [Amycolatopsis thermoflava]|uniref:sulfite exporter TauE/SafE family protein n=1 Tax=Amycolatopsis thermoflava TaxID=84480 RepID=UPI00041005A4|nr:sulfite exporter TauE/SafE family protein [Amycolatopsis thermoflava]
MPDVVSFSVLLAFGCLTGVTTVLFGFGGGFLTVPVVFAVTGQMHVAVATSAAVMVVNSLAATLAQARAGRLRRDRVWPLAGFIAAGAALGALTTTRLPEPILHAAFVAYLLITIADCLLRSGFLDRGAGPGGLGPVARTAGGVGIGVVASALGVGGSVLTVPLLRRSGLPMTEATAIANPLSAPVAVVATVVYAVSADGPTGYVDVAAAGLLLAGSLPAIAITRRVTGRIPDRVHAIAYVALLVAVTIAVIVTA